MPHKQALFCSAAVLPPVRRSSAAQAGWPVRVTATGSRNPVMRL